MELLLVLGAQCRIGIDDCNQLYFVLLRKSMEEAGDVSVFETDDRDADRLLCLREYHRAPEHQNKELYNPNNGTNEHT